MKILYIANDRRAAELAALSLRALTQDVAVSWAASLGEALRWIDRNRDVATLIVEVESDNPGCESFVSQVRGLGVAAPMIAVSVKDRAPSLTLVKAAAGEIVTKDARFLDDLPGVVRRTLHAAPPAARRRLRLLYLGDAALARECLGRPGASIDVIGAVPALSGQFDPLPTEGRPGLPLPFDILLIEHGYPGVETLAILKDIAARKLHVPVAIVAEWDEELAVLALELGAVDYLVKSRASFRAALFRLNRLIAHSALLKEHTRLLDAHAQARQDRSAAVAAGQHTQRESNFAARLAEATAAARQKLKQQLADRDAELRNAEQRAAIDRQTASQDFLRRQTELEAALAQELAQRHILETKLAGAETWYQVAEQLRAAEAAASAEKLAQQHEEFTTGIAQAVRARDALEQRMNDALTTIEQARRDRAADAAAAAEHLAQREAALMSKLGHAATAQERLVRRLADADTALRDAEQRAAAEQHAARQQSIEQQAHIEAELALETANRGALERQLAEAKLALQRAEAHHTSEMTATDARLAEHQKRFDARLSRAAAALQCAERQHASDISAAAARLTESQQRAGALLAQAGAAADALKSRLAETTATLERLEVQAGAERQAASEEAAQREAELEAELTREVASRQTLAEALAEAETARQDAEEQHSSEMAAAAARLADHQQQAETRLTDAAAAADTLEARLVDAAAALERAEQRAAVDRQAATELALRRQAEFDAGLAVEVARHQALGKQLADTEAALQRAGQQHASEMSDAAVRLAESQQGASALLAQARAAADALESRLAETTATLERVEMQAGAEQQAASEEAARREAKFEAELTREAANRQAIVKALADAEAARKAAEQQHASELAAAAARLAEYQQHADARLAQTAATAEADLRRAEKQHASEMTAAAARLAEYRKQAEAQMAQAAANTAAALETAEQQAASERKEAAGQAARLQARFETELKQEVARRLAVEGELAEARAGSEQAQLRLLDQIAAVSQRAREHETRLEERAARDRAEWETTRVEGLERIRQLQMEGNVARQSLVATGEQIRRLEHAHREERANLASARMAIEADLARQCAGYTALQQTLDQTRATAHETLDRVSKDRATERVRLESLVADRDAQLQEQTARKEASDQAAARTLADVEHRLRLTIAAGSRDSRALARLQEQFEALDEELEATRSQREVMKAEADRVPQLRKQIDDMQAENRRQFDHTPVTMCRCGRDGAMKQVTHALAHLLGYDTPEELLKVDLASTVFESGGELQWMVDRCLASRSAESVETSWRRRDGSSLIVRVLAVATTPESIDLAAQDITALRVLEEKLRNAQRMEAVARYASEVAVTCDNLLGHVKQEGQQWLATIDSDRARYHGELLLDEVTRAAGFLRQLAVYGNEQKNAPDLVDVNRVLRDLEPVLKRVAGGNIDLVLPKASAPLNLDVEAERFERMLVNVAAYGRERMPSGGQLMIDVASVVVDRNFVAKYPNVRPGAHVLLTVNEVRGAVRPGFLAAVLDQKQASRADASASGQDNPGVDLGALQTLVSDCGGHLWIMAEPPGDMVLKIHLPRRVLDRLDPRAAATRPGRARWINWAPGP